MDVACNNILRTLNTRLTFNASKCKKEIGRPVYQRNWGPDLPSIKGLDFLTHFSALLCLNFLVALQW